MPELLRLPEIATGTTEAVLSSWNVAENSTVAVSDVIAVVETAKAVVDVEAETSGTILRLLVAPGAEVETGAPLALLARSGETVTDVDSALAVLGVGERATAAPERDARVFSSPLARRLARDAGLPIEQIDGTGPNGRIVRRDVERARAEHATPTAAQAPTVAMPPSGTGFTDLPHTPMRRAVAARLTESVTTAPHFYLRATVPVDRLLGLRAELNGDDAPVRVSVNDLVVKAVAQAHLQVPELNVSWLPDAVRSYSSVDVAVAVATDRGLVTPVLRSVEAMTVTAIARTTRDLVDRARSGRLQQHELEGGSITVTNLGMHGTEDFAAIINPPQAAILAVGATRQEPVAVDGRVEVATVLRLTLSVDHRPVDGVVAARWMTALTDLLRRPGRILA